VNCLPPKIPVCLLLFSLLRCEVAVFGAWPDPTAGLPPVETIFGRTMGSDETKAVILQDELGRLFVGSDKLLVFDGQNWRSHSIPQTSGLASLALGEQGKIWAGAINQLGYFQEESPGAFKFRSLLPSLPEAARDVGTVWGCAPVGPATYFICRDKLLRWNGSDFQITSYEAKSRLAPLKLGSEWWFHHLETGLYRLTETGPTLVVPASELTDIIVLGIFRDETGLVTVSNNGFIRPGHPAIPFSQENLNQHLGQHRVTAVRQLSDGNLVIGTLSGGLVLASPAGKLIRIWNSSNGLPGRGIHGLTIGSTGEILGITSTDFFHFPGTGEATVFNSRNGLKGQAVNHLLLWKSQLFATTEDGAYRLDPGEDGREALFQTIPGLTEKYYHMLPYHGGLLLSRFGGVDWFDGSTLRSVYRIAADSAQFIIPSKNDARLLYVVESRGLSRLIEQADGSLVRTRFLELPDFCSSLHEDPAGRLWIGTLAKGVFCYDPATAKLSPINDPATGKALPGSALVRGDQQNIFLFLDGRVLQADADGKGFRPLEDIPAFTPLDVFPAPNEHEILVSFKRTRGSEAESLGVGVLAFTDRGQARWRELDLPSVHTIGSVRALTFSEESGRPILWLGGSEGILRLDYDKISTLQPPAPPLIQLANSAADRPTDGPTLAFKFKDHRVQLVMSLGDFVRSKDWLIQTRLGESDWSAASPRRSFEFTNLSEGEYRFEARTVNSANLASAPSTFTFTILPPWYRSVWAYAGYAASMALGIFGFIRIRERRIRARNRELEALVDSRTEELVKANAAKDEFLASVSHEIRNPMNGVIGIAETFKTDALDPDSQHKFGLLRQCANHLSSLLEDILDFSRVQAGAVELEARPFNLPELVESIVAITAADSTKCGIPVEIAISPAVPPQLTGDPRRVRQILLNFVSNALKFSGRGQVSVTVWCKARDARSTEVIFAVSDEGPGIAPEEQKKLFTRFERGAAAQQGRLPGTGLGLALCKALAEKMGGRIWLESEPGQGSCFYFSAPFTTTALMTPAASVQPVSEKFKFALVVDDEEYNRIALADLLESLNFSVQTAADGPQALALAREHDFDIIFLDYALTKLSGPEVARALRQLPSRSAEAVILATTAYHTPDKRAQCLAAGMDAFLGKPVTLERLRQAMHTLNPPASPVAQPEPDSFVPADRLANLRLLAAKKHLPFAEEVALYLSELEVELAQLTTALRQEDTRHATHYAHLLYGRCAFIHELALERTLRKIESAAATGQWEEARFLGLTVQTQLADLRVSLAAFDPAAPPGSVR
jgi:signal transduction histidine kinase/CheY-like chemotaxis protein